MDDTPDVATLVAGLVSENDSVRKYAVFRLQNLLGDPSFADAFIQGDGLLPLRYAVMETQGNTQAYAVGSLDALLELDMGWEAVDSGVIEKAVSLAVTHPLVNIVRNVLTLLVLIVSRPLGKSKRQSATVFGFRAIKPALDNHPNFLESLVQRLSASDHTLCANALQLVNALMRDAVVHGGEHEWPKFIKRLQDLGVIGGVGMLMRGDASTDTSTPLAQAILEFQGLTKVLLRKWKEVRVNIELPEHKRALKTIHLLSKPEPYQAEPNEEGKSRKHHPEKWRRLGFESESPAWEFDETGYLGMMDFVDYTRRNEDAYQKILMEQSVQPKTQRCPLARASMSTTLVLYEHFDVEDSSEFEEQQRFWTSAEDRQNSHPAPDRLYRPLLLQWGRLHAAALNAFMRMWKISGAEAEDFYKIEELLRIIVERIVGAADRKTDVGKVEEEMRNVTLATARVWQMEGLDEIYEDAWGPHLVQVRQQLQHESLQFMKEQRIRCLLQGGWFPSPGAEGNWRYVRLNHNRRWLHWSYYPVKEDREPLLAELVEKVDLNTVTSVDSNVSANEPLTNGGRRDSRATLKDAALHPTPAPTTNTKITILGGSTSDEAVLLDLYPQDSHVAAEWLDGLLLLLNQQPITKDTTRLIDVMCDWGVRLRLLNLNWDDVDWEALEQNVREVANHEPVKAKTRPVPSREGLDTDYWFAMPVS
nr:isoform 2 of engulfment and cell motility protein 2 [Quercus suber]